MENCGSCRHWTPPEKRTGYGNVVRYFRDEFDVETGDYKRGGQDDKLFGECELIGLGTDLTLDKPTPKAVTKDGSEYMAILYTQVDFGCTEHEVKT